MISAFGLIHQEGNVLILNYLLVRSSCKLDIKYLKTIIHKTRIIDLEIRQIAKYKRCEGHLLLSFDISFIMNILYTSLLFVIAYFFFYFFVDSIFQ